MNPKSDTNNYSGNDDFKDDDFIFNNNEEESTPTNPAKYNKDPFISLKRNHVEEIGSRSRGYIKIFTFLFILMLAGWIALVIFVSYNPDVMIGKDSKSKFELKPNNVEAKTNNPVSGSQKNN